MFILSIVPLNLRDCLTPSLTWGICNSIIKKHIGAKPEVLACALERDQEYAIVVNQHSHGLDLLQDDKGKVSLVSPNLAVLVQIGNQTGALVIEQIDEKAVLPSFEFVTHQGEVNSTSTTESNLTHEIGTFLNIKSTDSVPLPGNGLIGLQSKHAMGFFLLTRGILTNFARKNGFLENPEIFDTSFEVIK